ncbi:RTA1-domain-containing protein [Didymella exigua CBS 183.55]|uniref:RTA1-domain-containing protein n=1 Tax=Didymella exigua CBS 183.55 TaxID=1150837 RepID=A0A6A5RXE7_9PLEO|nr:RTA1-domain-containing protein [Didymella exigua CBS 183.55]KAF1933155.1 RTA1-domain-containing protein [Didymella exigua CBS 183.55]
MANPPSSPSFDWKIYPHPHPHPHPFTILTLLHGYSYVQHRRTSIIYIILGGLCEIAGFSARIGSHFDDTTWAPFIIQGTLLLVGPLLFAATVYMMLGQAVRCAGADKLSRVSPRWYTRIFVTADISTLLVQGLGASLIGTMQLSLALAGEKVVIAGLALQVATFVVFLVAAIDFRVRMNIISKTGQSAEDQTWKRTLRILYALSSLVLFRCVFRLIEYAMGNAAYLIAHEWTLYVFDSVPMLALLVVLFVWRSKEANPVQKSEGEGGSDGELGIVGSQSGRARYEV